MTRLLLPLLGCLLTAANAGATPVTSRPFGTLPDGRAVTLYTLAGPAGFTVEIADYGATIVSVRTPDRAGRVAEVTLGFPSFEGYIANGPYFGCVVGRVGNRIAQGRFELDGHTYVLETNNAPGGQPCSLHGGRVGFGRVLWRAEAAELDGQPALRLAYTSPAGEGGFPGTLQVQVTYSLTRDQGLRLDYEATTDAPTPVNLTNHAYFNLRGEGTGDVLDHELTLRASRYTPVNAGLIPTGGVQPVAGTPFDFTHGRRIGDQIGASHPQLEFGGGYDHNFVLDRAGEGLELAATVYEPTTGRVLEVLTTEPGIQFYSGNFLDGTIRGKSHQPYIHRGAVVLETQHFPDAVHQPDFPSTILRPGGRYTSCTVYRFSTR